MAALDEGLALHNGHVLNPRDEILHNRQTDLLMGDLPAAEANRNLDLVSTLKELDGRFRLGLDIVFLDRGGELPLMETTF